MSRLWTDAQTAHLAQRINTDSLHSIAEHLGRTVLAVRQKQISMGLSKRRTSPMRCAVLAVLQQHGPMPITAIAEHLEWPREIVQRAIACARSDHPGEFFRITQYAWQESGSGGQIAFYSAPGGKDAPKPRASKKRINAQKLAHYYRHKAVISTRGAVKRAGASMPRNPWLQLAASGVRHAMTAAMKTNA